MESNLGTITPNNDYEFIGFMFNEHHCSEYGLTTVAPSNLFKTELFGEFQDKLLEVPGRDGAYCFGTSISTKKLSLTLAFDNMTSLNKKNILQWLKPRAVGQIIFDEAPYKYYYVKIAAQPSFSFVPFETQETINGVLTKTHIFKGILEIEFIALNPYSYSSYALISDVPIWNGNPSTWQTNKPYSNTVIPGWYGESGLHLEDPSGPDLPLAKANGVNGWTDYTLSPGDIAYNFYNGGDTDALVELEFIVPAFETADAPLIITNTTNSTLFTMESLKNITALVADAGPWTIKCETKKGLVTTTINTIVYNLGNIITGTFILAQPGDNTININKSLNSLTIKYKYTYF